MRITITGATGFVGSHLSNYLEAHTFEVTKLSLRNKWTLDTGADVLIHLAGIAHDTANSCAESEYYKVNTDLTVTLFDEFLTSGIRDFFYFSSVKASADTVDGVLDEAGPNTPQTPYGKSKMMAEEYLLKKDLPTGKRLFIIRPCMIHGPGNKGNLNLLYQVVTKNIPWPLAAFENKRSFLSIENLNFLICTMIQSDLPSGIYNFADDEPVSTNRLVELIAVAAGKRPKLWKIPQKLISFATQTGDLFSLPLNTERLKKLTESYVVSNLKVKRALGIVKLPVSAEEGLIRTLKSFKK